MPWNETVIMQRLQFILACQSGENSITSVCEQFGISRKTGYKWLQRFVPQELSSLQDRSHARLTPYPSTPDEIIEELVGVKLQFPDWGPQKVRDYLINKPSEFSIPATSTIGDIFKSRGLVEERKRNKPTPRKEPLREITYVNQVWSADFKGKFKLKNQRHCSPFTLTDNYSRYLLACDGTYNETTDFVKTCFERVFLECGLPDVLRTDNGRPFAGTGLGGLSQLSIWIMKLGIILERIHPGKPTENGRHERMHRSLKRRMFYHGVCTTLEEQQVWFDGFLFEFNEIRPHWALQGQPPSTCWKPSEKEYTGVVPELFSPDGTKHYFVRSNGCITLNRELLFISEALRGEHIWIREKNDEYDEIGFGQMTLAYYDKRKHKVIRAD